MAELPSLIPRLRSLLATGFAPDADGALKDLRGLAHPLANRHGASSAHENEKACACRFPHPNPPPVGEGTNEALRDFQDKGLPPGWIVSQRLLAMRPLLDSDDELVCALLALRPEVRQAWVAIAAARCREAGQMAEGATLIALVSALQGAAAWVEAALPQAQLTASPQAALERTLLNMSFEQAAATPALMRILAVAAKLTRFEEALPALSLIDASGNETQKNWLNGRLLALPETATAKPAVAINVVLPGGFESAATATLTTSERGENTMTWVLSHPWVLLLAMVVYAQDVWKAEARGGFWLESANGQNAFNPNEISLLVLGAEGDEVRCGTLADLLLKSLDTLGMSCFPLLPAPAELNTQLAPLVGMLLALQVWRYQEGGSGQNGQYLIHPQFADACYRLPGSKVFNRNGKLLWQAVRISAESLYREQRHEANQAPPSNRL